MSEQGDPSGTPTPKCPACGADDITTTGPNALYCRRCEHAWMSTGKPLCKTCGGWGDVDGLKPCLDCGRGTPTPKCGTCGGEGEIIMCSTGHRGGRGYTTNPMKCRGDDGFLSKVPCPDCRGTPTGRTPAPLTFERFSEMNRHRCESYNGFGESLQQRSKYTTAHWALSICSEAGEVCDAILGYEGLKERRACKTVEDIAEELADVVTYCDLLVSKLGFNLADVIAKKFDKVTERAGFADKFRLNPRPTEPTK